MPPRAGLASISARYVQIDPGVSCRMRVGILLRWFVAGGVVGEGGLIQRVFHIQELAGEIVAVGCGAVFFVDVGER